MAEQLGGLFWRLPQWSLLTFESQYSDIRTRHATSTEDCLDLSHPVYWRNRQACEQRYQTSAEQHEKSECLTKARTMYKRELQACMDDFKSGISGWFF